MTKELPEIKKSPESEIVNHILKVVDVVFPVGNYWWYIADIIMLIGLSLFGFYTGVIISLLDGGLIIQTDSFVAVMPLATSHMQTPLSNAVMSILMQAYSYLMLVFAYYIGFALTFDIVYLIQERFGSDKKEDDEL
jgi:hypothetical protein